MKAPISETIVAEPALAADQLCVAHLFAAMDDRRQQEAIVKLTRMASMHPRHAKPKLQLIKGGAA